MDGSRSIPKEAWYSQSSVWYAAGVIGVVVLLSMLSKWSESDNQYSDTFIKRVKMLIEQATRWNSTAQQDTNPIVRLIHCGYALVYAQIARSLVSDRDIETITGIDIHELLYYFEECQSYAIKDLGTKCPSVKIDGVYSAGSGWV